MKKISDLFSKGTELAKKAVKHASDTSKLAKGYWDDNKDDYYAQGKEAIKAGKEYASSTYDSATETASNIYRDIKYSENDLISWKKILKIRAATTVSLTGGAQQLTRS